MNEDSQILKERERDALQRVYMLRPGDRPQGPDQSNY
jgi:hypothetical protein